MKIATYNVNGVNGRLPALLQWLKESSPDVVCLQELKAPQEKYPEKEIAEAGYQSIWLGQKSWNGVAILSKSGKPEEIQRGLPGNEDDEQSRYLEAKVDGVIIGCLYLPNGNPAPGPKFDYKLRWMEHFTNYAAQKLNENVPVVLTGDYNVIPTEADAYKPERWVEDALFRPETREAFQKIISLGWTDALRHLYPDETIYTYWDYFRSAFSRNAGIRIDHFLVNDILKKRLKAAGVDKYVRGWEKTSDHAPVWIDIRDDN